MRVYAVDYYRKVAKWMLPHLKNVPVSFKRYPGPVDGESFWEKDAPSFTPSWVRTLSVPRRSDGSEIRYIVVDDVKTLTWIASVGAFVRAGREHAAAAHVECAGRAGAAAAWPPHSTSQPERAAALRQSQRRAWAGNGWFNGKTLRGPWVLEKVSRSWSLAPAPTA